MVGLDDSECDIVEWIKYRIDERECNNNEINMKGIVDESKIERTNGNMCKR